MNLYNILFEEKIDYSETSFALFVSDNKFVLVNKQAYEEMIVDRVPVPLEEWCSGYISIRSPNAACSIAHQIESVVASPKFPGVGTLLYSLSSKYLNGFLTSDRNDSTSDSAKKVWSKIEMSSEWEKLELDNFYLYKTKLYADIQGSHPAKTIKKLSKEPKTSDPSDDCILPLPSKGLSAIKVGDIINELGTQDAYKYNGNEDPKILINSGIKLLRSVSERAFKDPDDLQNQIIQSGEELFEKFYNH